MHAHAYVRDANAAAIGCHKTCSSVGFSTARAMCVTLCHRRRCCAGRGRGCRSTHSAKRRWSRSSWLWRRAAARGGSRSSSEGSQQPAATLAATPSAAPLPRSLAGSAPPSLPAFLCCTVYLAATKASYRRWLAPSGTLHKQEAIHESGGDMCAALPLRCSARCHLCAAVGHLCAAKRGALADSVCHHAARAPANPTPKMPGPALPAVPRPGEPQASPMNVAEAFLATEALQFNSQRKRRAGRHLLLGSARPRFRSGFTKLSFASCRPRRAGTQAAEGRA